MRRAADSMRFFVLVRPRYLTKEATIFLSRDRTIYFYSLASTESRQDDFLAARRDFEVIFLLRKSRESAAT